MNYIEWIEENKDQMISSLQELVRIPSVNGKPCRDSDGILYPFGKNVDDALAYVLQLGEAMGFQSKNVDHYCGHVEWTSDDPAAEIFAIAGHVDVVPEGDGWEHDPFGGEIQDGWMFGRGTLDDKGPVISCLYAMKALKDAGWKPTKTIRLIIGLDEEIGDESTDYYLSKEAMPDLGITPDGDFPLTNGEMGTLTFQMASRMRKYSPKDGLILSKISAGTAPNIVPNKARGVVSAGDKSIFETIRQKSATFAEETGYTIKTKKVGSSLAIEAEGVSVHGATPGLGLNAISVLMAFLGELSFQGDEITEWIDYYNQYIGFNLHGENMNCALEDEPSGKLICNVGMMEVNHEMASVTLSIRYPVHYTGDDVYSGIEKTLENTNIGILKMGDDHPVYTPVDDPFIQTLLGIYQEETGDMEHQPWVDSGGTYAKVFRRMVAFGAMFPGEVDCMHQPNERLDLDAFMKMTRIYATMLERICCTEIEAE